METLPWKGFLEQVTSDAGEDPREMRGLKRERDELLVQDEEKLNWGRTFAY